MNNNNQLFISTNNLKQQNNLSEQEVVSCITELTKETVSAELKTEFLRALAKKGETEDELAIFIREFRKMSIEPELQDFAPNALDLCGTGGDKANSFNISTFVSFLIASAGIPVIKHGNRSISSKCGSADLIEGIGIPLDAPLPMMRASMEKLNYTFLFAPKFHPAFQHIAPVRKALAEEGIITIFNLLGPTINPAKPANQVLGVFDPNYLPKIGKALTSNKVNAGLVVHGLIDNAKISGVDELTNCGGNCVYGIGKIETKEIETWQPRKWNTEKGDFAELSGGDLNQNLRIMKDLLEDKAPESLKTTILLNASTAFWIQGKCSSLGEGMELAESLIVDGVVKNWLEKASNFFK